VAPYARARDLRVTEALGEAGVQARPHGGNYVVDVSQPRTQAGDPYSVFSPFWRRWQGMERRTVHRAPQALPSGLRKGRAPHEATDLDVSAGGRVDEPVADPGEAAAGDALRTVRPGSSPGASARTSCAGCTDEAIPAWPS